MKMGIQKELFEKINTVAKDNLDRAQGMIDIINMMCPTKLFFINKRVCYESFDHGVRTFHDAYIWAE